MIVAASTEKARLTYRPGMDGTGGRISYMGVDLHRLPPEGAPDPTMIYPTAFLVMQAPHKENPPHFHVSNQFQIFVGGSGRIGRHRIEVGAGHFSAPFSPYGPIIGGDDGVQYLTLRNSWDHGAQHLPAARNALRAKPRKFREEVFGPVPDVDTAELELLRDVSCISVLDRGEDGLGGWFYRAPPGATVNGPDPRSGGGQYWVVMAGSIDHPDEGMMSRLSCVFISPDETPFSAIAGRQGLAVLVLQFPFFALD